MRNFESTDDLFLKEMLNPSLNNGRNGFYFHPLCEVVYDYDQELLLGCGEWDWSQDVHSLYSKRLWTSNWMLNVGRFLRKTGKLLALGALLNELDSIF